MLLGEQNATMPPWELPVVISDRLCASVYSKAKSSSRALWERNAISLRFESFFDLSTKTVRIRRSVFPVSIALVTSEI
jgi:hypothetical protein